MRNEDTVFGIVLGVVLVFIAIFLVALSSSVALRAVTEDCGNMGQFRIKEKTYECKLKETK
jgi:gas vesicle protein